MIRLYSAGTNRPLWVSTGAISRPSHQFQSVCVGQSQAGRVSLDCVGRNKKGRRHYNCWRRRTVLITTFGGGCPGHWRHSQRRSAHRRRPSREARRCSWRSGTAGPSTAGNPRLRPACPAPRARASSIRDLRLCQQEPYQCFGLPDWHSMSADSV